MAERRMFTMKIIDSDAFLDMPLSTQALYFHLNMRADDDGFCNNPKRILRMIGAAEDDLKVLLAKRFIIGFERGIIVIKHWRMHNAIKNDRYHPTEYQEEFKMLALKPNKAYTDKVETEQTITNGTQMEPEWNQDGTQTEPEVRLGKDRIGKVRLDKDNNMRENAQNHKYGSYQNILLTDEELEKLKTEFVDWQERIERLSEYIASTGKKYKSHLATIRSWARREVQERKETPKYNDQKSLADTAASVRNLLNGGM